MGVRATATIPLTQTGLREPLPLPKRPAERRWVGFLSFNWAELHKFSPQEVEIYKALIGLASPSVENRRLFEQTRARAERERFVRTAVDRIRQGTDTEAIMRITLQELGQMLGASKSIVRLGTREQLCPESVEG
jgi:GAF domain-containing protein